MEIKKKKIALELSQKEKECIANMLNFTDNFYKTIKCSENNFNCCDCPLKNFCGYDTNSFIAELEDFVNDNM